MCKTLEDAYRRDLSDAQSRLEQFWRDRTTILDECAADKSDSAVFAKCVTSGWADSVVCYDGLGGVCYPAAPASPSDQSSPSAIDWEEARLLENEENNPGAAAKAYAAIARETKDVNLFARALQGEARCLVQSGDLDAAVKLIISTLSNEKYNQAVDLQGRLIVPNAQLMALKLMGDREHSVCNQLADLLQKRLNDYANPAMSGAQRLFLMQEFKNLSPDRAKLPLLPAEELAARFIEVKAPPPRQESVFLPSPLPGIWQLASSDGRLLALWQTETIVAQSLGDCPARTAR